MVDKKFNIGDKVVLKKNGAHYEIVDYTNNGQFFLKDIWAKKKNRFIAVNPWEIRRREANESNED